jgi:hypothetical protein
MAVTCPDGASGVEVVELVEQPNWIPETKMISASVSDNNTT